MEGSGFRYGFGFKYGPAQIMTDPVQKHPDPQHCKVGTGICLEKADLYICSLISMRVERIYWKNPALFLSSSLMAPIPLPPLSAVIDGFATFLIFLLVILHAT